MKIRIWTEQLRLTHPWRIARTGGTDSYPVLMVELRDGRLKGIGEAAPSGRYNESIDSARALLEQVDINRLSFDDLEGSMAFINKLVPGEFAAKGALNVALLDAHGKKHNKPICDLLGLGFREGVHRTSFSIGIDSADKIRAKVAQAKDYPILKLKVGVPDDRANLEALREMAPTKRVRLDANEGWKTKEEALKNLEWFAADGHIEFVEQPLPATVPDEDFRWLKKRTPLPIMADESYRSAADINRCGDLFHGANVKLVKAGGITAAMEALQAARKAGLKTMLGCMIESSVLITAAAHLAELTDYLDLDGNILINNDPYTGVTSQQGLLSFVDAEAKAGLRVSKR